MAKGCEEVTKVDIFRHIFYFVSAVGFNLITLCSRIVHLHDRLNPMFICLSVSVCMCMCVHVSVHRVCGPVNQSQASL